MSIAPQASPSAQFSEAEWALRVELACCYRLIDHFGLTDLVYNHITVRLPDDSHPFDEEIFLINGFGLHYTRRSRPRTSSG